MKLFLKKIFLFTLSVLLRSISHWLLTVKMDTLLKLLCIYLSEYGKEKFFRKSFRSSFLQTSIETKHGY